MRVNPVAIAKRSVGIAHHPTDKRSLSHHPNKYAIAKRSVGIAHHPNR
ncbi:hypothetical protein [Dolichospermum circinale]|nr:hypothetical protein [Dolichospermum circinale]MDB9449240.1 hypothetical protein [Dolichospermum circinale CS-547]